MRKLTKRLLIETFFLKKLGQIIKFTKKDIKFLSLGTYFLREFLSLGDNRSFVRMLRIDRECLQGLAKVALNFVIAGSNKGE